MRSLCYGHVVITLRAAGYIIEKGVFDTFTLPLATNSLQLNSSTILYLPFTLQSVVNWTSRTSYLQLLSSVDTPASRKTMYFLIHTSYHARPFLTTVAFIARDFRTWGCRVDCHASDSPYIAEIKLREKQARNSTWRAELMELWAREVISRKRSASSQEQDYQVAYDEHLPAEERRFAKVSNVVQDFIHRVAAFGEFSLSSQCVS